MTMMTMMPMTIVIKTTILMMEEVVVVMVPGMRNRRADDRRDSMSQVTMRGQVAGRRRDGGWSTPS